MSFFGAIGDFVGGIFGGGGGDSHAADRRKAFEMALSAAAMQNANDAISNVEEIMSETEEDP
ncbi:hypothetical protein [Bradyrhizobium sp. USDA 10063]